MDLHVPEPYRRHLRIGTCSWKYDSWKGLLYDAERSYRPFDYLPDYARALDSVEIDQWFWCLFPGGLRMPDPETVRRYADSVPDDFKFTIKAPNALTLTNFYTRQTRQHIEFAGRPNPYFLDNRLLEQFLALLEPLHSRIGTIMFQFEYLNRGKMRSMSTFMDRFEKFMGQAPRGVLYSVETRNPAYLTGEFFERLESIGLGFVYLDGYHMPPIAEVFERYSPRSSSHVVLRLIGPDRADIERRTGKEWNRIVDPRPGRLGRAAAIARSYVGRQVPTFVNVNNHYEGSAPLTIERFLTLLDGGRISAESTSME